jgi:hypothetical protein
MLYRMGEEKDDTSKELVLPVTKLPPGQSSTVVDMGIQKRPGKAPKPTKPVVKDQVFTNSLILYLEDLGNDDVVLEGFENSFLAHWRD